MARHGASLRSLAKDEHPTSGAAVARRLLSFLRPYRRELAAGIAWLTAATATSAITPALSGRLIDTAVQGADTGASWTSLVPIGLGLLATSVFGWWAQRAQILTLGFAGQRALWGLRAEVFGKIQRLSVAYFENVESGDLMSRLINDIETVNSFLSQGLRRVLAAGLGGITTLAAMVWVDWRLALVTLLVVPVLLGVTRLFGVVARRAFRTRQEAIGDISATLAEELSGIRVAQAFNRTERNRSDFADRNAANRDANINAATVSSAFSPTLAVLSTAATALVVGVGSVMASRGLITIGTVVAFFGFSRSFFNAVSQLSSLYGDTQSALAGGERVFALMDTPLDIEDSPDAEPLPVVDGRIDFDAVSFSYATGGEVLHDISLTIQAGTSVAIVGPTGAGKTTLVNLVPRFYEATAGRVLVDGHDVRAVRTPDLRRGFGMVLQDPFLFSGTIAENIRYGRLDATDEELLEAARISRALEFVRMLPDGFDTQVGERGVTLSTGQRQLIAFARAVLADPAILILDEATSSVDTRTEALIQDGLRALLSGRTSLIIAHRLSTVRDADRILVLVDGRIAEDGTYPELLAAGGPFSRLQAAQFAD